MSIKVRGYSTNPKTKKVYRVWTDIKRRCYNIEDKFYIKYGARGIKLQSSWENDAVSFCDYILRLPNYSKSRSLDRIDNNLGYQEGNLRWATDAIQTINQGKQVNNTSGVCGITWYYNNTGGTRAIAWCYSLEGKTKSKSFPVKKFGLLPAFAMACNARKSAIESLNSQGAGYSANHGK